jgi:hypothetical protein
MPPHTQSLIKPKHRPAAPMAKYSPSHVPKKIKFLMGTRTSPVVILAVDNFRLVRMQLQLATLQPRLNAAFDGLRSARHTFRV